MKIQESAKRHVLFFFLMLVAFTVGIAAVSCAENPVGLSEEGVRLIEQCEAAFDGNSLVVTDTDDNGDVWSSKLLLDAGLELTPGEAYTISFSLAGANGVGEFFLCRSENIDDRYDETFAAEAGTRSIAFTASQNRVWIGMQVGNLGKGRSVTAMIADLSPLAESANPGLLRAENCTVSVEGGVITAVDTGDNNDVWNSKLLYDAGALEVGKTYCLSFSLAGENGVGEFFICKSPDLNHRYDATFVNAAGPNSVVFTAESDRLLIGMQFGDVGLGNEVEVTIGDICRIPGRQTSGENVADSYGQDTVTLTDTDDNPDVWSSKAVFDSGIALEPGTEYTATFTLTGDNGVGEFFFLKSDDINNRYSFDAEPGTHTITFTAEDAALYFGIQCGNIGNGNSVTISDLSVTPTGAGN